MDYALTYNRLIAKARQRSAVDGYVERHHVLPKALGGTDDSSNIVALTAREHFIAHLLLARMHGGSMWFALAIMRKDGRGSSRSFAVARAKLSSLMIGNSKTLGRKASDEEREKMSAARKGKLGRKLTSEQKLHLSAINQGKSFSKEHRQKLSEVQKGLAKPEGFGAKISSALRGKPRSEETKRKLSMHYAALREAKKVLDNVSIYSQSKELT
jgi:hypothetical protein